jgi:hypothetical protein
MTCSICAKERATKPDRIPKGWHRLPDMLLCDICWHARFVVRTVTMPVAGLIEGEWDDLWTELRQAWGACTQAANWMMTELYAHDVRRTAADDKIPAMKPQYLYPHARERFPALAAASIAALEQTVTAKYRHVRYDVLWRCASTLPTFRYPFPLPIPATSWAVEDSGERCVVSLRLLAMEFSDRRWRLRLRLNPRYSRQLAAFRQMALASATPGQASIYERTIDGKRTIMFAAAGWFPRRAAIERSGELRVRTATGSLLVAANIKDECLWNYHADHVRRWSAEHRLQLQRWADDSKHEQRPVPSFAERRIDACRKYRNRMDSAVQQIAEQLAAYADRRKFALVTYDDSDQSYCRSFPYYALKSRIQVLLDERGINFALASSEVLMAMDAAQSGQ